MKKILLIAFLLSTFFSQSQTYIKANVLTTILTVPHVGIETSIGKKSTFQFDVIASFWKSINGHPSQFYIFTPEYRYHFKEKFNGFYAGAHIGATVFRLQKWNYYQANAYQEGVGYMGGVTVGYQKKLNKHFLLDFFIGGGSHQGFYKGYLIETGERYEPAKDFNKSGEWLPYRGGVMISYRID